ncbi:Hypothetical protein mma_2208 [Janthinobacterium sp. Marseille]|nr:hypothetical protein [Janthinobacterium sp. Marseille]ABR91899.1 Hypothetical protein mma_2208 [Janthinobacterium sp. Marseille]
MSDLKQQSSTSTDWPAGAIPERWVRSLFEKMLFTYGSKFADQWKGIDPEGLKRHWAAELGAFSPDELKAGVAKLKDSDWPPSLSQFQKMCKIERQEPAHVLALPAPRSQNADKEAKEMISKLGADEILKPKTDHKLWAKRIVKKSKQPLHGLSALQIRFAKDALNMQEPA